MRDRPFDAVICDVDGVVRLWDRDGVAALDVAYDLPAGTVASTAFAEHRLFPAITGAVSDEEWRAGVVEALAGWLRTPERATAFLTDWSTKIGRVDTEVVELLTSARVHVEVGLLSNATTVLERHLRDLGVERAYDVVVNTSREGVVKPAPEIYRIAADRVGVPIERCAFVDDTEANVVAARELGMTAVHYSEPAQLRHLLAPLLENAGDPPIG